MRCCQSLAQDGSPTNDVLACFQFFCVAVQHLGLDVISQGFGLGLCFFDEGFQILQSFDLGSDFSGRHFVFSFSVFFDVRRLSGCHSSFVFERTYNRLC